MTSATEKLRRMLEERGVEYEVDNDIDANMTSWNGFTAMQFSPNAKLVMTLTPEQAIAATLWSDKCRIEHRGMGYYCSECGEEVGSDDPESELYIYANAIELWSHCPRCGCEVVDA